MITWSFFLDRERCKLDNKVYAYIWIFQNWREIMDEHCQDQAIRILDDWNMLLATTYNIDYLQIGDGYLPRLADWIFDLISFIFVIIARHII